MELTPEQYARIEPYLPRQRGNVSLRNSIKWKNIPGTHSVQAAADKTIRIFVGKLTFDMRGGGRLAGRRPLDGRVRPHQRFRFVLAKQLEPVSTIAVHQ